MEVELPIHHVIVIGFHHKKGSVIEFAYPPFETDIENTAWKHLPTLCMPDGAHNFTTDTVYFHLPSLKRPGETVFGVACYQQIDAEKIKNKSDDVTRSTIQKSVCVLSRYPLYGHIQVKMTLITAAYFREGDFGQVSILEEAYHNLNACLSPDLLNTPEAFVGLSPRDLVSVFRYDVLVLLKLLLLEKRILFRGASVGPLCSALLTLVSLIPHTLEYGMKQSASVRTSKTMSIVPQFSNCSDEADAFFDAEMDTGGGDDGSSSKIEDKEKTDSEKPSPADDGHEKTENFVLGGEPKEKKTKDLINSSLIQGSAVSSRQEDATDTAAPVRNTAITFSAAAASVELPEFELKTPMSELGSDGGFSVASEKVSDDIPDFVTAVQMTAADAGLPLSIFTKGYMCHPYLSLHYMDLLSDSSVRGFIVGATNMLFKQKRDLVDVVVEMQDGSVEISDPTLKKLVTLSTEDLRFAENIVRTVTQDSTGNRGKYEPLDSFMDGVGWEGGDEWIRAQFKYYLMCLMRTSLLEEGNRLRDSFDSNFLTAWQLTHHWKIWNAYVNSEERVTPCIYALSPGHPCIGQISMSDMKLRLSHSIQKTEGGRKLNQAVGKAVTSTSKAVGGALSQAKGALSSWWSSVTTAPPSTGVEFGTDEITGNGNSDSSNANPAATATSTATTTPQSQTTWFHT